jgi:hypothetical protein
MASQETQNNIFSQKTFRLLGEWSQKYDYQDPMEISFGHDFRQCTEKPFKLFCEKVANALPPHFSVHCIEKNKTFRPYMEKHDS